MPRFPRLKYGHNNGDTVLRVVVIIKWVNINKGLRTVNSREWTVSSRFNPSPEVCRSDFSELNVIIERQAEPSGAGPVIENFLVLADVCFHTAGVGAGCFNSSHPRFK